MWPGAFRWRARPRRSRRPPGPCSTSADRCCRTGPGALVEQAIRRGHEAERRGHDLVAGLRSPASRTARASPAVPLETVEQWAHSSLPRAPASNSGEPGPSARRPAAASPVPARSSRSPTSGGAARPARPHATTCAAQLFRPRWGACPPRASPRAPPSSPRSCSPTRRWSPGVRPSLASSRTRVTAAGALHLVQDAHLEVHELDVADMRVALADGAGAAPCRARARVRCPRRSSRSARRPPRS